MYIAMLLFCMMGAEDRLAATCATIGSQQIFDTEQECQQSLYEYISRDPELQVIMKSLELVDIQCFKFDVNSALNKGSKL